MEKNSWTDCVRNEKVVHRVKEERNVLQKIKRKSRIYPRTAHEGPEGE